MTATKRYDVAVVGAGVFGAWTAWYLARRGQRVLLVDAYGIAHSRSSSGGESRIIRMGYGADELYTRWSQHSLTQWKDFFAETGHKLFRETGVLWLAETSDARLRQTVETLKRCGIQHEEIDRRALENRFPQIAFDEDTCGLLEPHSGVLMARRAVAAVVQDAVAKGVDYRLVYIAEPRSTGRLAEIKTSSGERLTADQFVFACGPWLGKLFPDILGEKIFPSRQEVFFFGVPANDPRFTPPAMPTWLFQRDEVYGMPDLEGRGFKIALDHHGQRIDPDTQSRIVSPQSAETVRRYVAKRFPALRDAPIVETRVCQYENTSNGDFLIDRHPQMENVWFAGGGSGHGFKHGPAFGEYVAQQVLATGSTEPRFSLSCKSTVQSRAVY